MKVKVFVSQSNTSSLLSKTGSQLAKVIYDKFDSDLKLPTKNEFSTSVRTQFVPKAVIDGPRKGYKSNVMLLGSFYTGKSLVGGITYPLNAVAYDKDTGKCYLFIDRKYVGELSNKQFMHIISILQESVIVSSPSVLERLIDKLMTLVK